MKTWSLGMTDNSQTKEAGSLDRPLGEIRLVVPEEFCRAFHRCVWMQVHESGRTQLAIMKEMVHEYLISRGC